jgi:hypothetical protein
VQIVSSVAHTPCIFFISFLLFNANAGIWTKFMDLRKMTLKFNHAEFSDSQQRDTYITVICASGCKSYTIYLISIDRAMNFSLDITIYTTLNVGSIFVNIESDCANWTFPPLDSFFFNKINYYFKLLPPIQQEKLYDIINIIEYLLMYTKCM